MDQEQKITIKKIEIEYSIQHTVIGLLFCLLGIALPSFLTTDTFYVEGFLDIFTENGDKFYLLLSVCGIVFLNSIRALPFYLGTFLIAEHTSFYYKNRKLFICNCVMTFLLLSLVYKITNIVQHMQLYFGYTSYLVIIFVLILLRMDLFSVSLLDKSLLLVFAQLSLQWFDEIPALTKWGFGHGNVTLVIKETAVQTQADAILTRFVLTMAGLFALFLILQTRLLYQKHHLKISAIERQKATDAMYSAQIEALKLRTNSELHHLVHDLKSPLTTIQGLSGLALMMEENDNIKEYIQKIDDSSNIMNSMISDILYEDKREDVTTKRLIDKVLSQVFTYIPQEKICVVNSIPDRIISVNIVRFARALVNLLDNASRFIDAENGIIKLHLYETDGKITFEITDNGKGISQDDLKNIWDYGFSGRNSTGLGLSYVRQTVEKHGGTVHIASKEHEYTTVMIQINGEGEDV